MPDRPRTERVARSVDEAREIILAAVAPLPEVALPLADALGLALTEPLVAARDSPPFPTAAMDGFAVISADIRDAGVCGPVRLVIAGEQAAGDISSLALRPGEAVRIMTGAPCPPGADTVVPFELTAATTTDVVAVMRALLAGANIRPQGEQYRTGDPLLAGGSVLGPAQLALIAANGLATVQVRRAPRVAVVAAGNELRTPGEPLAPGQIWDSNSVMLAALCRQFGAEAAQSVLVSDREDEIERALDQAQNGDADLIVTVGGISAGDYDHLKHALVHRGDVELWDVAMRPGKPLAFGRVGGCPVIGLPGNPAAAFVAFHQFVRPAIARMMGTLNELPRTVVATVAESFQNHGGRRGFVRVVVTSSESGYVVRSAGSQSSASILSLARANGLLVIPEAVQRIEAGGQAQVQILTHHRSAQGA